jgi:DNA-directed RNA polymerase subunit RPC12/RpoP
MSELRIDCPHCGSTFNVMLDGEPSSMMVFACAKCKTPLMYCNGVTSELDREEFTRLRERLNRVLSAVMKREGEVSEVAASLKKLVDESNARADERHHESAPISDEALAELQKGLSEMDVDSFLAKL